MQSLSPRVRIGIYAFIVLAILTIIEYIIAVSMTGTVLYLSIIALAKAGVIAYYFMHISQLRHPEGH